MLKISQIFVKSWFVLAFIMNSQIMEAQQDSIAKPSSEFWKKVKFGGGLGLAFGNGYTDISVSPIAVYTINPYVGLGLGLQGGYIKQNDYFKSFLYGGSILGVFNPHENIQLSTELEQLRVNRSFQTISVTPLKENFWNTALFLGAGYRDQNVTFGIRYNILYTKSDQIYNQAWMPFVRVFF